MDDADLELILLIVARATTDVLELNVCVLWLAQATSKTLGHD